MFNGGEKMDVRFEIEKFIETKENNGSLMITGNWGCGKTFLVRQLTKTIEEKGQHIFVICSLFGIDSINSLHMKIKEKLFYEKLSLESSENAQKLAHKAKEIVTPISAALGEVSKVAKGINTALSVNIYDFVRVEKEVDCRIGKKTVTKKLVLIFDDLERSKLKIIDVLGAINDYSENKSIKTIVIADEERIKDTDYKDFKEKLISRTVRLTPDYESIIKSIISNYIETEKGYKTFLQEQLEVIYQVFEESSSENLRSLKSYLMDFERVFAALKKCQNTQINNSKLLYMFGAMLFGVKSGKYKEGEYGFMFADSELSKQHRNWENNYALKSLKNWIVDGVWEEVDFCDEINQKFVSNEIPVYQSFLYSDFFDLEKTHIIDGLPTAVQKANNGELSGDELISLLVKIHAFRKYEMDLPCEIDYNKIDKGLEKRKQKIKLGEIREPKGHSFAFADNIDDEAKALYKKIDNLEEVVVAYNNEQMLVSYLKGDKSVSQRSLKGLSIEAFSEELMGLFLSVYDASGHAQKRDIAIILSELNFNNRFFVSDENKKETKTNLEKLLVEINKRITSDTDPISSLISKHFIENVKELIDNI